MGMGWGAWPLGFYFLGSRAGVLLGLGSLKRGEEEK